MCSSHNCRCYCHYNLENRANVFTCSSMVTNTLPSSVPAYTNCVLLDNNKINNISPAGYLDAVTFLSLQNNTISNIPDSFIRTFNNNNMKWIKLADTKLTTVPKQMQNLTNLNKIWLSGNPFHCDCEMTWMIGWLNNFTTP